MLAFASNDSALRLARSRRSVRWTLLFALTPSRGFESRTLLKGAQSYLVDLLRKKWRMLETRGMSKF